jgi:hypothetical protein
MNEEDLTDEQRKRLRKWDSLHEGVFLLWTEQPLLRWLTEGFTYLLNPDLRPYLKTRNRASQPSRKATAIIFLLLLALVIFIWLVILKR